MALVDIPGGLFIPAYPTQMGSAPSIAGNALLLDAASEAVGPICQAPKAGNIAKIGFRVHAVTSAPTENHDIRLESVDLASGLRSGSLVAANANASALLDSTGWKLVTLTAAAAVTKGQLIAPTVKAPATNFGNIGLAHFEDVRRWFPFTDIVGGKNLTSAPCFTLEYDDGSYDVVEGIYPYSVINTRTYGSSTNPNRRGMRFQVPFKARLAGMWVVMTVNTGADFDVVFYASDGTTATTLVQWDGHVSAAASVGLHKLRFATPVTLEPNTNYRIALVPTTTTSIVIYDTDVNAAADLDAWSGGQEFHSTTVNGAPGAEGDWTQTLTNRPFMGLWFDQLSDDAGAGGGGGGGPLIGGRLVR